MSEIIGNFLRDYLIGTPENDDIKGLDGDDILLGFDGEDIVDGGDGDDFLFGGAGDDIAYGGDGDDLLDGGTGDELLFGGAGNDQLHGNEGNDILIGDAGSDFINGEQGDDILQGFGFGTDEFDTLRGGEGADTFVLGNEFEIFYQQGGFATIPDLNSSEGDKIRVFGSASNYSLEVNNNNTEIFFNGKLLAVVENITEFQLSTDNFIFS